LGTTTATATGTVTTLGGMTLATTTAATATAGATATTFAAGAALNAGFTSLVTTAGISFVNNGGDIGQTLKDLGDKDNVKGYVLSMATAGGLNMLGDTLTIDGKKLNDITPKNSNFGTNLGKNLVNNFTSAVLNSAVTGTSLEDNVANLLLTTFVDTASGQAAVAIGDMTVPSAPGQPPKLNAAGQAFAHALAGCIAGAIKAGEQGCQSGAVGAVIGEKAAQWFDPTGNKPRTETLGFARIVSAFVGAVTGDGSAQSVNIAADAGVNAADRNYLNHVDARRLVELQEKANAGTLTPQEAQERQALILKDQQTTAELDACRTKNTARCKEVKADFAKAQQSFLPDQQDIQKWAEAKAKTGPYSAAQLVDAYNANFTKGPLPPSQTTTGDLNPAADWIRNELSNDAKTNGANVLDKVYMGWAAANAPAVSGAFSAGVIPKQSTTKVGAAGGTTSSGSKPGAKITGADGENGGTAAKLPSATDATATSPYSSSGTSYGKTTTTDANGKPIATQPNVPSAGANGGTDAADGLAFRTDLPSHMIGPDGFTKSGQLSGTHNLTNATSSLDTVGATYTLNPTATVGIYEVPYTYINPATGKVVSGSKTVYDPAVFSDQTMLDNAQQAGQQAWKQYSQNPTDRVIDVSVGGVNFRSYINIDKNGNAFIGNVHPIK
jgi:uncharacterized membrane protein YeaQ/YmgE (transglycosylase-associated protein family)